MKLNTLHGGHVEGGLHDTLQNIMTLVGEGKSYFVSILLFKKFQELFRLF